MTGRPVDAIAVVLPIHNEADLLDACLRSIAAAAAAVDVPTLVVTVLDRCSDDSRRLVARAADRCTRMEISSVEGAFPHTGAVRNAGLSHVVQRWPELPRSRVWTAHTDADSVVPRQWLAEQQSFAAAGADLVLGTVVPDEPADSAAGRLWWAQHTLGEGHSAIHGANLGIRLDRLMEVGGFSSCSVAEDVRTVQRLKEAGTRWFATDTIRVTTSARREGRIPDGFAGFMRGLDALDAEDATARH